MRLRAAVLALFSMLALGAADAGAARSARVSRAVAERHILAAPGLFRRRGGRTRVFIDPTTKLFRTNVTATCRARSHRRVAHVFVCTVRYDSVRVRVRYVAKRRGHFRLVRLPHRR